MESGKVACGGARGEKWEKGDQGTNEREGEGEATASDGVEEDDE